MHACNKRASVSSERRMWRCRQVAPFLRAHGLHEGDSIGICTDAAGALALRVPSFSALAVHARQGDGSMSAGEVSQKDLHAADRCMAAYCPPACPVWCILRHC